ncbi:uncharacterized protein [Nicotiana tomentosiformis]|uniref:uncharacterized protein n=1 Tax=Nicotiana tomentosiformis TaxID=4098 RepID=UPI00388CA4A2
MMQFKNDERLIQFLMGLNEIYAQARSNILMINHFPSVNHPYSLLIQDENQREVHVTSQFPGDGSSFMAGNQNTQINRGNHINSLQKIGHNSIKGNNNYKGKKNGQMCSYCKITNHTIENCYRLIGFSSDFIFTKPNKFQGTPVQLLNHIQVGQSSSSEVSANSAADIFLTNCPSCYSVANSNSSSWIIDPGTSQHMCYNVKSFLFPLPLHVPLMVKLSNSSRGPLLKNPQVFGEAKEGLYLLEPHRTLSRSKSIKVVMAPDITVRQSRLPFPLSYIQIKSIFYLIHIDTWDPYKTPTYNGYKYFLTIVNDFSRATWTDLLSTKSNAFSVLKWFLSLVERQIGTKVKII